MGYKMTPDIQVHGLFKGSTAKGDKWVVSARVKGGNPTKITLGFCSNLPSKDARVIAKKYLADMALGVNPNTVRKMDQIKGFSLCEAIEQYMFEKEGRLKPSTVKSYNSTLTNNFSKWMNRAISSITPQECVNRYFEIKKEVAKRSSQKAKANEPGEAEAQKAMRTLGSVLQYFANDMLPDNSGRLMPFGNPVKGLADKGVKKQLNSRTNALNLKERRKLLEYLMHPSHYFNADMSLKEVTAKTPIKTDHADLLILLLCTGLRRDEPLNSDEYLSPDLQSFLTRNRAEERQRRQ